MVSLGMFSSFILLPFRLVVFIHLTTNFVSDNLAVLSTTIHCRFTMNIRNFCLRNINMIHEKHIRQKSGSLKLIEEFISTDGRNTKCVKVICTCGIIYPMPSLRWKNQPPMSCKKCSINKNKIYFKRS